MYLAHHLQLLWAGDLGQTGTTHPTIERNEIMGNTTSFCPISCKVIWHALSRGVSTTTYNRMELSSQESSGVASEILFFPSSTGCQVVTQFPRRTWPLSFSFVSSKLSTMVTILLARSIVKICPPVFQAQSSAEIRLAASLALPTCNGLFGKSPFDGVRRNTLPPGAFSV